MPWSHGDLAQIQWQIEKFTFRPKVEQCSQVKSFNWKKKSEKESEKPSLPSLEALIELVESIHIREEIKLHNHRNAKRRIQRKKFLELEKKEIEAKPTSKRVWQKKVSSSGSPPGEDKRTQGMESPASDSKPEPSP